MKAEGVVRLPDSQDGGSRSALRAEARARRGLRQNNPTGRIFLPSSGKSPLGVLPSCPRGRGVGHRHRTSGWDAVDAAASCARWDRRAGKLRERSQDAPTSGAEAYGKVVWFRCLSGWRQVFRRRESPTGQSASFREATEAREPDTPGRARYKS